jgi:hypothetical protein
MNVSNRIFVKDILSDNLAMRERAKYLFNYINKLNLDVIVVDFSQVVAISRSFAHEYVRCKKYSNKIICEGFMPLCVTKMIAIVDEDKPKDIIIKYNRRELIFA